MSDEADTGVVRWLVVALVVVAIVCLLAYRRNEPGVGGRVPDPEDAAAVVDVPTVGGAHHG